MKLAKRRGAFGKSPASRRSGVRCLLACLVDLLTTWLYAQKYSHVDELHPGIKLVTYAYGLTVGIAIAKLIQASLVLIVAAALPRAARGLMWLTTLAYLVAATWNACWL